MQTEESSHNKLSTITMKYMWWCWHFCEFVLLNWSCSHLSCHCSNNHDDRIQPAWPGPLSQDITSWLNLLYCMAGKQRTCHSVCPWPFRNVCFSQMRKTAWVYVSRFFGIMNLKYCRTVCKKCKRICG